MTEFVWFVFSTGGIVVSVLFGVVWLWVRPHNSGPRRYLLLVSLAYLLASIYGLQMWIARALMSEFRQFSVADVPGGRSAVIVMGSGSFTARDWDNGEYSMPDREAAVRVVEAARVYRIANPAVVISSGGKVYDDDPRVPTAIVMRSALVQLGVPEERIVLQTKSRNTYEEAIDDAKVCASLNIDRLIVVTSDFHMRRTIGAFNAAGVSVVPAIARDAITPRSWYEWWLPSDMGLGRASLNAHEVLGILYYRARGWYSVSPRMEVAPELSRRAALSADSRETIRRSTGFLH